MRLTLIKATCSLVLFCGSAQAELTLCNDTDSSIGAALAYQDHSGQTDGNTVPVPAVIRFDSRWVSEGWWNIAAHSCETLLTGALNSNTYYLYAVDYDKGGAWGGPKKICTDDKTFTIYGFDDCEKRGHDEEGFFPIDTRGETDWTAHLKD
jgi:uncharacterized membrane protein